MKEKSPPKPCSPRTERVTHEFVHVLSGFGSKFASQQKISAQKHVSQNPSPERSLVIEMELCNRTECNWRLRTNNHDVGCCGWMFDSAFVALLARVKGARGESIARGLLDAVGRLILVGEIQCDPVGGTQAVTIQVASLCQVARNRVTATPRGYKGSRVGKGHDAGYPRTTASRPSSDEEIMLQ